MKDTLIYDCTGSDSGGAIRNSIIWHNGAAIYNTAEGSLVLDGGTCTYTCAAGAPSAVDGNITDALPAFADHANGDYTLTSGSPCRSTGEGGVDMGYRPYAAPAAARCSFAYTFVLLCGRAGLLAQFNLHKH